MQLPQYALNPMPEAEYWAMAKLETSLWWYQSLHSHITKALSELSVPKEAEILDIGCGTGGVLSSLRGVGYLNTRGMDISQTAIKICKERGLNVDFGDLGSLSNIESASADVALSNDVLTVFPPDCYSSILSQIHRILRPGGLLVINLPARASFAGVHDLAVGNVQRIVVADFESLLEKAHFSLIRSFAWPFILSPLILAARLLQRISHYLKPQSPVKSDVQPVPYGLNLCFGLLSRIESRLPLAWRCFGSSQFIVCRKIDCL